MRAGAGLAGSMASLAKSVEATCAASIVPLARPVEITAAEVGTLAAHAAIGVQISEWIQPEIDLSWARDQVEEGDAPWSLAVTAGAQIALPFGRLGFGVQRVVNGADADEATSCIAELAISFD